MLRQDTVTDRRLKPCGLCGHKFENLGEPVIRFDSCGTGRFTTRDNLCLSCMRDIVNEADKWNRGQG